MGDITPKLLCQNSYFIQLQFTYYFCKVYTCLILDVLVVPWFILQVGLSVLLPLKWLNVTTYRCYTISCVIMWVGIWLSYGGYNDTLSLSKHSVHIGCFHFNVVRLLHNVVIMLLFRFYFVFMAYSWCASEVCCIVFCCSSY